MIALRWWDLSMGGLLVAMAAVAALAPGTPGGTAGALAALAVLGAGYLAVGRTALARLCRGQAPGARGPVFLVVVGVSVSAATAFGPNLAVSQAIAYPLVWTLIERYGAAIAWNVGMAAGVACGFIVSFGMVGMPGAVVTAIAIQALSLAFSIALGTWITSIARSGDEARALVEQLRTAQREIAILSQEAGAASERERLSRELHDTLTQTLPGLFMLAEVAGGALPAGDDSSVGHRLGLIERTARDALGEARALVATTHPLGEGGLERALDRLARRMREDTACRVSCEIAVTGLDREAEVVLLRAAQEGLANARKHASASAVAIRLSGSGDSAVLEVEDDGVGPGAAAATASGFGLDGLRDRVGLLGGRLEFGAAPSGRGALLRVTLPRRPQPVPPVTAEAAL